MTKWSESVIRGDEESHVWKLFQAYGIQRLWTCPWGRKTYREVISAEDVPWEVEMGKGGGGQRVGTEELRKAIHPCNMEKIQAQYPFQGTQWGLGVSIHDPAATSNGRTEVTHKYRPQKVGVSSFDIPSERTGYSQTTALSPSRGQRQNWLRSALLLMWTGRIWLWSLNMMHTSLTGHFYLSLNSARCSWLSAQDLSEVGTYFGTSAYLKYLEAGREEPRWQNSMEVFCVSHIHEIQPD